MNPQANSKRYEALLKHHDEIKRELHITLRAAGLRDFAVLAFDGELTYKGRHRVSVEELSETELVIHYEPNAQDVHPLSYQMQRSRSFEYMRVTRRIEALYRAITADPRVSRAQYSTTPLADGTVWKRITFTTNKLEDHVVVLNEYATSCSEWVASMLTTRNNEFTFSL